MRSTVTLCALVGALALVTPVLRGQGPVLDIDPGLHHLGDSEVTTWPEVPKDPEGTQLDLEFDSTANGGEWVLEVYHQDLDNPWFVELNGKKAFDLQTGKPAVTRRYRIPAGMVVAGKNQLSFVPTRTTDDIILGRVRLHQQSLRDLLRLQRFEVRVVGSDGEPLPARVTLADAEGKLVEHYEPGRAETAVRAGICYTADGMAAFDVPPGAYTVYASRGTEWSVDQKAVVVPDVPAGEARIERVDLAVRRELETDGWVACDTHIHTYTNSGHGDSTLEERVITLAAEGVELAIATDHNHQTDFQPYQRDLGLTDHFTSVVGNEVTTKVGHMNAFPLEAGGPKPDHTLMDWVQLVQGIREKGAKVVILNHPRWPQIPTGPFGEFGLSQLTGELPGQTAVPFDAMELVNSTTVERDPMFLFVDWFALLNHGQTITAAGTSDSHTVGDPVGQGRTYVPSRTDDPARIDVDASCEAFQQGRTTISMGIFVEVNVGDAKGPGDVCHVTGRRVGAELRVAAPSWVRPRTAIAFVNGIELARKEVPVEGGAPTDVTLAFDLALPPHDGHLVFVVLGDPVTSPHWRTMNRYTLAATNPVWLDVDSRNSYQSPRSTGEGLARKAGDDAAALAALLADVDDAVAVQALHAARLGWQKGSDLPVMVDKARAKVAEVVAARSDRAVLREYLDSLGEKKGG